MAQPMCFSIQETVVVCKARALSTMNIPRLFESVFACVHIVFAFLWSCVEWFVPVEKKSISGEIVLVIDLEFGITNIRISCFHSFSQITGAGRGLGKDVATVFSAHGCRLVLVDINLAAVQQTANEINKLGGCATAYRCDVSSWDEVVRLRRLVEKEVGPVDILVNNAGLIVMQPFVTNTEVDIERTVAVNVNGVLYVGEVGQGRVLNSLQLSCR